MANSYDSTIHITALKVGELPVIQKCSQCCRKNHCPFCPADLFKPRDISSVKRHLKGHLKRAVHHNEYVICKCHLECRTASHFHCVKCVKTIVRKEDFVKHLSQCKGKGAPKMEGQAANPTVGPLPQGPGGTALKEAMDEHAANGDAPLPAQGLREAQLQEPNIFPEVPGVAVPSAQDCIKKKSKIQCPHCNIRLHKKNFKKHSDRKHKGKDGRDVSVDSLLPPHRFDGGVFAADVSCTMRSMEDEALSTSRFVEMFKRYLDAPGCSISISLTNHSRSYTLVNPQVYTFSGCCYDPPQPTIRLGATQTCFFGKASDGNLGVEGILMYDIAVDRDQTLGSLVVMFCVPSDCDDHRNLFALGFFKEEMKCDESLYRVMCCGDGGTFRRSACLSSVTSYTDSSDRLTIRGVMTPTSKSVMKVEFWDKGGI